MKDRKTPLSQQEKDHIHNRRVAAAATATLATVIAIATTVGEGPPVQGPPVAEPTPATRPVPAENALIQLFQAEEIAVETDALVAPPSSISTPAGTTQDAAGPRIPYFAGEVHVDIALAESIGTMENWDPAERAVAIQKIQNGISWWKQWSKGNLNFSYTVSTINVTEEPVTKPRSQAATWVGEIQALQGATSPDIFANADTLILRDNDKTKSNFGFRVYVVDASNDQDGQSAPGPNGEMPGSSYAYLNGPFIVLYWNESKNGSIDAVAAHEAGHTGGMGDQYPRKNGNEPAKCTEKFGYNSVENQNQQSEFETCLSDADSIMRSLAAFITNKVDAFALAQGGLNDSPGDFNLDVLGHPNFEGSITGDSSIRVNGAARINAHPAASGERAVNINTIAGVDLITSDGIAHPLQAADGKYDSSYEQLNSMLPRALGITAVKMRVTGRLGGQVVVIEQTLGKNPKEYQVFLPLMSRESATAQVQTETAASEQKLTGEAGVKAMKAAYKNGQFPFNPSGLQRHLH